MSGDIFDNYGQLKAAVADWLMRQDLEERIPQFIRLAEAELDKMLRTREMIQRRYAVAEAQYIDLPRNWRKAKNVQRLSDGEPLGFMTYDEIDRYRAALKAGRARSDGKGPAYYALVGNAMELAPAPSPSAPAEIEMIYYANVPRLTEDDETNWLLRDYPEMYLYGALVHSAPFLKEDERLPVWQNLYQQAITFANESDADARFSGAPLMRRGSGFGV